MTTRITDADIDIALAAFEAADRPDQSFRSRLAAALQAAAPRIAMQERLKIADILKEELDEAKAARESHLQREGRSGNIDAALAGHKIAWLKALKEKL
jgi:hypothetical protein